MFLLCQTCVHLFPFGQSLLPVPNLKVLALVLAPHLAWSDQTVRTPRFAGQINGDALEIRGSLLGNLA